MRQARLHVIGVLCGKESVLMAVVASRGRSLELIVDVARSTVERGMHPGESEAGIFQVIELGAKPGVHGMAVLAGSWKTRRNVVKHGCLEVLLMAGVAGRGEAAKLPHGCALMASHTVHHGVGSHQGEAVLVILNLLDGHLPALYRMAAFTVRSELPAMEVRMTVGATCACITKT